MQKLLSVARLGIQNVQHFDIEKSFGRHPLFGSSVGVRIFISLLLLNIAAYFLFVSQHPIYNHGFRFPWVADNLGVGHGRWFNLVLRYITNSADIYAFVPLFAIFMNVSAGLMTVKIWKLKLSSIEKFLIVGLITTYPAFLTFYYFSWTTILFMSGVFFAIMAIYFCRQLNLLGILSGGFLVLIMMASYQPSISVYATVAAGAAIAGLISRDNIPIIDVVKTLIARVFSAGIGLGAYLATVRLSGINTYTTDTVKLADVPKRILKVIDISIQQLFITQPDLLAPMKMWLLILLVLAVFVSVFCVRKSIVKIALVLGLWFGMLIVTKTMYMLSPNVSYFEYRYNTSLAFFHTFTAAILIYGLRVPLIRSAAILFISFILIRFVQADLIRQEVLLRGQQHDLAFANRLLVRMESLPEIDFSRRYDLIRVGGYPKYRETIFKAKGHNWEKAGDYHLDDARITSYWADEDIFILLGSKIQFQHRGYDPNFRKKSNEVKATLLEDRKPWPHETSVFISGDKLIVYLEQ